MSSIPHSSHIPLSQNRRRSSARKSGFSLVEILIVIALIMVLATVAIGNLSGIFGGQQEKVAEIFVTQTAKTGLVPYRLDVGNYPSTEEGLEALVQAPPGKEDKWKGPYLEELPEDPWGNPYQYRFPGKKNPNGRRGYDIWSLGPDGKESDDDIGNW
ncbi:MAG: type II secretion system major pseudopilin GspG [Opitutales bacterium]